MPRPATSLPVDVELPARHPNAPAPGTELGSHYARCFACGEESPGGLRMRFVADEGLTVRAEFPVTELHQGAPGLAHGGLLACAFDEALGALQALQREPFVTGRLETEFLRPVPVGTVLHIRAWVQGRSGRKLYVTAQGHLDSPDGEPAVQASAVYIAVDVAHFHQHGRPQDVEAARRDPELRASRHFEINP